MFKHFDTAVQVGISAYRRLGYSSACGRKFQSCMSVIRSYLEENDLQYSKSMLSKWIESNTEDWGREKTNYISHALAIFDEIYRTDKTTMLKSIEDRKRYLTLPNWSRSWLDEYILAYVPAGSVKRLKGHGAIFFRFLEIKGINTLDDITVDIVRSFVEQDVHKSEWMTKSCHSDIFSLLEVALKEKEYPDIKMQQIKNILMPGCRTPELIDKSEKEMMTSTYVDCFPIQVFDEVAERYHKYLVDNGYTKTPISEAIRITGEFRSFLLINSLPYSHGSALVWLEKNSKSWSYNKYLSTRRVLLMINELLVYGECKTSHFIVKKSTPMPVWCVNDFSAYLEERKREDLASSTICMIYNSCKRFFYYLDTRGIFEWEKITPWDIKDFHANDKHSTVEGKSAYAVRVQRFLKYLARHEKVPYSLVLAMPTVAAPNSRIIKTLDDSQIDRVYDYRADAITPYELRASAIVTIAINTGLRASDIVNLRMSDISWKTNQVSIVQKKTDVPLIIDLKVDYGNSIWRYIHEGRPKQAKTDHIFVSHKAPFSKIGVRVCTRDLERVVCEDTRGFHITRRTHATKMLASGNDLETVAATIGWSSVQSADRYIAADQEHMRLCPLNLDGINYTGGLGL